MARINDLIARFAQYLDDGRFDQLQDLFRGDASFDILPAPSVLAVPLHGAEAIRAGLQGRHAAHESQGRRRHVASTATVDFVSAGLATARSYQTTVLTPKDGTQTQVLGFGVYEDRLVEDEAVWRFQSRLYLADTAPPTRG